MPPPTQKRARRGAGGGRRAGGKGHPPSAGEEAVFPSEGSEAPREGRLELPPSGLAADILALAGAQSVPAELARGGTAEARGGAREEVAPRAHNISFFAAPVREERKAPEATEHLATFFLGREEYGVDVRLVQEIIRVSEITQVPRAPEPIKGVINLRGRIIPVVDLKRKLGLGEVEATRQSRIVVVKVKERLVGLLVDGASQVLKVPLSSIETAPEEVVEKGAGSVRGVAKLPGRLIILMDLAQVLAVELGGEAGGAA
ncbi:MAG TPA: chemotaxis protein CheW [Vicinamibacteria bacterium]|nr:chemotaxis protein CheW [Vicinamibacteria bacterium]